MQSGCIVAAHERCRASGFNCHCTETLPRADLSLAIISAISTFWPLVPPCRAYSSPRPRSLIGQSSDDSRHRRARSLSGERSRATAREPAEGSPSACAMESASSCFPREQPPTESKSFAFIPRCCSPRLTQEKSSRRAAICYALEDGVVGNEVCWWGNAPVGPHMLNLLGKRSIAARIIFGEPIPAVGDRKVLGSELRAQVTALYGQIRSESS